MNHNDNNNVFHCGNNNYEEFPKKTNDSSVLLNGQLYKSALSVEDIQLLSRFVRKEWFQVQRCMILNQNISDQDQKEAREFITKCLKMILHSVEIYKNCSTTVASKEEILSGLYSLMRLTPDLKDTTKSPTSLYLHINLDIKYYLFIILSKFDKMQNDLIDRIIRDLIFLNENRIKTGCKCIENFWQFLQKHYKDFWQMFKKQCSGEEAGKVLSLIRNITSDATELDYIYLEDIVKELIRTKEPTLRDLENLEKIICDEKRIKSTRIELYQILWDYFGRRLNKSRNVRENMVMITSTNTCHRDEDFLKFIKMLVCHLTVNRMHWGKIKGRIYSQLGVGRIRELNEAGIYHILMLFLSLFDINYEEASKQFIYVVENLQTEKRNTMWVWKLYSDLIIKYVEKGIDIEKVAVLLIRMLEQASHSEKFHLISEFVDNFDTIIKRSKNFQLNQQLLLNSWIAKYIRKCTCFELEKILKVLYDTINRVDDIECKWSEHYLEYVRDSLKTVCASQNAPDIVGALAAKICLLNLNLFKEDFDYFNKDSIPIRVSGQFLFVILENYPQNFSLNDIQEKLVLQRWIKISLLYNQTEDLTFLNDVLIKFTIIPNEFKQMAADEQFTFENFIENLKRTNNIKLSEICFELTDWLKFYLETSADNNNTTIKECFKKMTMIFDKIGILLYNKRKHNNILQRLIDVLLLPRNVMAGDKVNTNILNAIQETWMDFFVAILNLKRNDNNDIGIDKILKNLIVKYMHYFNVNESPLMGCFHNEILAEVVLDKFAQSYYQKSTTESEANVSKSLRILCNLIKNNTTSSSILKLIIDKTLRGLFELCMFHNQRQAALNVILSILSSPFYDSELKENFNFAVLLTVEKYLSLNTSNCFQLLFLLAKYIPADLKSMLDRLNQMVAKVERLRGVGFDQILRNNLEHLKTLL